MSEHHLPQVDSRGSFRQLGVSSDVAGLAHEPLWRGIWVVLALQTGLLFLNIGRDSLWLDEMTSLSVSTGSVEQAQRFFRAFPEQHPLYYIVMHGWLSLGESATMLRAVSAVSVALSTLVMYALARELMDERRARITAVLSCLSPFLLYYGQEGRMYAPLLLLTLVGTWLFQRWLLNPTIRNAVLYVAVCIASIYTHLVAAFMVIAHVTWALAHPGLRKRLLGALGLGGVVAVAYSPWLLFIVSHPPTPQHWKSWENIVFGIPYTLLRWAVGYSILIPNAGWKEHVLELARADALILVVAFIGFGAMAAYGARQMVYEWKRVGLVIALLLVPAALALAASPVAILVTERYLILSYPAFLMLLSTGLDDLLHRTSSPMRLVAPTFAAAAVFVALWRYYYSPAYGKAEWREVARYVASQRQEDDAVVLHDAAIRDVFRYYYPTELPAPLVSNHRNAIDTSSGHPRVWLVVAHASDAGRDVMDALGQNRSIVSDTLFVKDVGIRVVLFGR